MSLPHTMSRSESPAAAHALQRALDELVAGAAGSFAFYVHDVERGLRCSVRQDETFPAASVIKLPIMLCLLEMVQQGKARLEQTVPLREWHRTGGSGLFQYFHAGLEVTLEDACTAMVAISDNTATNLLLDVTGIEAVNRLLDRLECPRTRLHRYFGKPEMPGPAGPSQAVPSEIGLLLERILRRDLLTPELNDLAVVMLRRQNHRALIPRFLPEGTPVAHKTGSLNGVRHDAGIVWLPCGEGAGPAGATAEARERGRPPGRPVVFVGMSREVPDVRWTVENEAELTIARAARLVYDGLTRRPLPPLPRPPR